jgi:hypothetical protein
MWEGRVSSGNAISSKSTASPWLAMKDSAIAVRVNPGAITKEVIPDLPKERATDLESEVIPPLEAA